MIVQCSNCEPSVQCFPIASIQVHLHESNIISIDDVGAAMYTCVYVREMKISYKPLSRINRVKGARDKHLGIYSIDHFADS